MKILLFRIIFLLLLVFLQISFFNILFPWFRAPLFLLGVVVAFALVRSFPQALFMTVPLTLLYDAATVGAVSWFTLYAVLFAYVTSFLLRRLFLEHHGLGLLLYAIVAYGAALLYQKLSVFAVSPQGMSAMMTLIRIAPSTESLIFSLAFFIPVFCVTYVVVKRFDGYLDSLNQKQFRNVR